MGWNPAGGAAAANSEGDLAAAAAKVARVAAADGAASDAHHRRPRPARHRPVATAAPTAVEGGGLPDEREEPIHELHRGILLIGFQHTGQRGTDRLVPVTHRPQHAKIVIGLKGATS